jgi:citrate lyase subunit beta / citryl-CoA lyase
MTGVSADLAEDRVESGVPVLAPLYVPGDRPDRFAKAMASEADAIIIDLEDAVAPQHKDTARQAALDYAAQPHPKPVYVRINAPGSAWFGADLRAVASGPHTLRGLRVPKVERPSNVRVIGTALEHRPLEVHCVIESAAGLEAAFDIASAHPAVSGVSLGEADLSGDLNVTDEAGLAWARGRIVVAARAAALPPPLMSVFPNVTDSDGLRASSVAGRRLGFLGRTLIHPRQAPVVLAAFAPSPAEVESASAVLAALSEAADAARGTAVLPNGRFVDRAMAQSARRVLAVHEAVQRLKQ